MIPSNPRRILPTKRTLNSRNLFPVEKGVYLRLPRESNLCYCVFLSCDFDSSQSNFELSEFKIQIMIYFNIRISELWNLKIIFSKYKFRNQNIKNLNPKFWNLKFRQFKFQNSKFQGWVSKIFFSFFQISNSRFQIFKFWELNFIKPNFESFNFEFWNFKYWEFKLQNSNFKI